MCIAGKHGAKIEIYLEAVIASAGKASAGTVRTAFTVPMMCSALHGFAELRLFGKVLLMALYDYIDLFMVFYFFFLSLLENVLLQLA